ncbi:MAG: tRNA (adenosine(37)-N6)-threonylcarbamoyltransferase complex dimerization subunit type 1 TsaB [Spirochaetaceae bacterium]|nr:MAG: tRNA (adenosine(37)-N6)-threonylcarbamoyltransferase complex dimerization subunit type 1 TsaB [Spirochaetaceae bacterium]
MNSLAIDTATTAMGLALKSDAGMHALVLQVGLKHSEKLMPAVRNLLREAGLPIQDLDLIVCSTGPGSFTGIRIGLATAKGLVAGIRPSGERPSAERQCRLIGVSTLDGLAYRYRRFPGTVVAVNPSLRKKHYAAFYRAGALAGEYLTSTLSDLCSALSSHRPVLITGAAACDLYELMADKDKAAAGELIVDASGESCNPVGLLACGEANLGEPETEPVPLYLRKSDAEITFFGE